MMFFRLRMLVPHTHVSLKQSRTWLRRANGPFQVRPSHPDNLDPLLIRRLFLGYKEKFGELSLV